MTTSGKQTQTIPHPRPVTDMNWRMSQATSRDDSVLYTVTSDATLRVFLPVLDAPQHIQLHASLDLYTALPFSVACHIDSSYVFWLDREIASKALTIAMQAPQTGDDDTQHRRVREIKDEGWDLFLRVLSDGSLVVQAVANIDRRPPTLLKQFTLLQSPPSTLPSMPTHLYVLPNPVSPGTLLLITSPPITVYILSPLDFFDTKKDGLQLIARGEELPRAGDAILGVEKRQIIRFERTPDGEGIGTIRMDGAGETWSVNARGSKLISKGRWKIGEDGRTVDQLVVLKRGDIFLTYSSSTQLLTLHTFPPSTLSIPSIVSLFPLPTESGTSSAAKETLVGITDSQNIVLIDILFPSHSSLVFVPSLSLRSFTSLPLESTPKMVLPVDPMAWSSPYTTERKGNNHDILLSVSEEGELAFWVPIEGPGLVEWKCTGTVRTRKTGLSLACCSSAKKSVLVVPGPEGEELTIWDSQESEFASGLEYQAVYGPLDQIHDLDWSATPDNQSILAVGFAHRVDLMCQQRMTYFDESTAWGLCWSINLENIIPHTISDSTWLKRGSLLVGAGHLMCLYAQPEPQRTTTPPPESLFEYVARYNGPLADYHPQMLLQCLLWGKIELVKSVIVNLARCLEQYNDVYQYQGVPLGDFLKSDKTTKTSQMRHKPQYSQLFSVPETAEEYVRPNSPENHVLFSFTDPTRSRSQPHWLAALLSVWKRNNSQT